MTRAVFVLFAAGALVACQTTSDPSQGGFLSGVSAINSGAYEDRAAALDAQEDAERARQRALTAELGSLEREFAALRQSIQQSRARLRAQGTAVSPALNARADATLSTDTQSGTVEARVASLRSAVASARDISAELARATQ